MTEQELKEKTISLIDSLKQTTGAFGLGNGGDEYRIIIEIFLYKFFNDRFGYDAKNDPTYGPRLKNAEKWDNEYDTFSEDEVEDLFSNLDANTPKLLPSQTISHIWNAASKGDFSTMLDTTLSAIGALNAGIFGVKTAGGSSVSIFSEITKVVADQSRRSDFAKALIQNVHTFNFEEVFNEKYDFFSSIFEYLIKDYNNAGGGKYAEYYTPRSIAQVMARLLVEDNADIKGATCYDPSAGTGTLLMALAHQIGEDRCSIYSQDISNKSSEMLRLNLVLNNLAKSLKNVVQGNTLTEPAHKNLDGSLKQFDFIVSNPPFKLDFNDYRDSLAENTIRFWAGVPNKVKEPNPTKPKMSIYTMFIQHLINSLTAKGRGAIVVPTGFITSKSGVEKNILKRIVDDKIIIGVVSMPSNVFATTGTNVSVLFFDKSQTSDGAILIDASKLGEEYKENNNVKHRLRPEEIDQIVSTFKEKKTVDDFSVYVSYDQIKEKGYSLSAGQYFDIKIEHIDITEEEFNQKMAGYKKTLKDSFQLSHDLENEILNQLDNLKIAE